MNHGHQFDRENAIDRKRQIAEARKAAKRKKIEQASPLLLEVCEKLAKAATYYLATNQTTHKFAQITLAKIVPKAKVAISVAKGMKEMK